MSFAAILFLAFGLAMDAAAVSAAKGLSAPRVGAREAVSVAIFFGGFQALMPLVGWLVGARVGPFVEAWGHFIAFGLLALLGGKMIHEATTGDDEDEGEDPRDPFAPRVMLGLAVATSIDALAVGVTLPMLHAPLGLSLATIGLVTAGLSMAALFVGRRFGKVFGKRLDALGGVVLVGLGLKILVEHWL